MDSWTDFERDVTSWVHEAKGTLSDLIKVWRKVIFWIMCSINTEGTTECTKFCETDRKRSIITKKRTARSDGYVGDGQSRSGVEPTVTWREIVKKKKN